MVETAIADYLVTKTTLQKSVDLFAGGLPGGTSEGVAIQPHSTVIRFGELTMCLITCAVIYNNFSDASDMAKSIADAFSEKVGVTTGDFGSTDPVTTNYYGTDNLGRNLFAVTCEVCYNPGTF